MKTNITTTLQDLTLVMAKESETDKEQLGNANEHHTFVLTSREAKAASPEDMAVCGEEDPGEALEFLVTDTDTSSRPTK